MTRPSLFELRRAGPGCRSGRNRAQAFSCECDAGGGFEVAFEGEGLVSVGEGQIGFENPRSELFGVGGYACVVLVEPLAKIFGEAGVDLLG